MSGMSSKREIDDFVALQRASRADKADFMTPEMRRSFFAIARQMLEGHLAADVPDAERRESTPLCL